MDAACGGGSRTQGLLAGTTSIVQLTSALIMVIGSAGGAVFQQRLGNLVTGSVEAGERSKVSLNLGGLSYLHAPSPGSI